MPKSATVSKRELLIPRPLKLQPSAYVDNVTDDGYEFTKLPYPFYVYKNGRIGRQDFWRGKPKRVVGLQKDLAKLLSIDLTWREVWANPESAVGLYLVTADGAGNWSVHTNAIISADVEGEPGRTATRDAVVAANLTDEWMSVAKLHDLLGDNGWSWSLETTRRTVLALIEDGRARRLTPGRSLMVRRTPDGGANETEALVAQMDQDFERRDDLLADFLPYELETFINQLAMLRDAAKDELRRKAARRA